MKVRFMPAYLSIIRPVNGIMSALAVYIASIVSGASVIPQNIVLFGMLAVFLVSGGGMVINDLVDAEIDKINKPKRPIPSGKISKHAALIYAAVLFVIGNFIAFYFISENAFYVAVLATFLLCLYAAKMKKVIMAGHIVISLLVGLTFIYGGVIVGNYQPLIPLAVLAFLSNMGREVYKTIDDVLGDKQQNIVTMPIKYGVPKAKAVAGIFIALAVAFSFVPYYLSIFKEVYLFFVVIADIVFIATIIAPTKLASKLTKLAMLIALIAFLAGAYSLRI